MSCGLYARNQRPFSLPRRRRNRRQGGGSRHRTNTSSFNPWSSNTLRYGNSRRSRPKRRRPFWLRDRDFVPDRYREDVSEEEDQETPEPPSGEVLEVTHTEDVNFHIEDNTKKHRTDRYDKTETRTTDSGVKETGELVVRRGQEFMITLELNRPYQKDKDDIRLIFQIGKYPSACKGTRISIKVNENTKPSTRDPHKWSSSLLSIDGKNVTLSVYPAANCIIGEWDIRVETVLQQKGEKPKIYMYDEPDNVFIILNPFCKDDTVYMSTQGLLDEYILNEQGCQWRGSSHNPTALKWFFGQFEEDILDVSLLLLRKGFGGEITRDMANPVKISRMLSKMVNANNDDGLLYGKWGKPYSDGTSPSAWVGSVEILKEYWRTRKSVMFGQCWVFSGVLTTVCRALGMPCRSVTNYGSAHDVDEDAAIHKFFTIDDEGKRDYQSGRTGDSIWNYHVWNEVWCTRPDLRKEGYDSAGWQALDATPQEASEGVFQCGPCPVVAIREGNVGTPFDGAFLFGEVNCNVMYFDVTNYDPELAEVNRHMVGKAISTKKPNGLPLGKKPLRLNFWEKPPPHPDRLDLTSEYKPPDGSEEEMRTLENVAGILQNAALVDFEKKGVVAEVEDLTTVMVGSDFEITCTLTNPTSSKLTVNSRVELIATDYTGNPSGSVLTRGFKGEVVKPRETKKLLVKVTVDDYLDKLEGENSMRVDFTGQVVETKETFAKEDDFTLDHPEIEVTFPGKGPFRVDEAFQVHLVLNNPVNRKLTGLKLMLEGPGIRDEGKRLFPRQTSIDPKGKFEETVWLTPKKPGKKTISVSLDSEELPDINGDAEIEITK